MDAKRGSTRERVTPRNPGDRFAFTKASLDALQAPKSDRITYHDTKQPGLQLRVSNTGVKTFSVLRRPHGRRPERFTIGRWPDLALDGPHGARAKAAHVIAQLASAESPAEARRKIKGELTLGELFDQYMKDRQRAGRRRIGDVRATWELYIGALPAGARKKHGQERKKPVGAADWSRRRLSEITKSQISTLHSRIVDSGKPFAANRVHELLRAMFNFAIRQELIDANPADGITPAAERPRSRFLGKDELPQFIEALKVQEQPWRDFFTVLLYLGYRRSAVAAMRWRDADLEAGTWSVPGERAKNGDPIVLPITGPALETLKRRHRARESAEWVFPGGSTAGHITQPKEAWKRLLKRAGISDLRIHDLRRTLGSWLAMSNVSLPAIGRILGHKDQRSTAVYAHLQTEAAAIHLAVAHKAMKAALTNPKVVPLRRAGKSAV